MKYLYLICSFLTMQPLSSLAENWYVSGNGNDGNDGLSAATAFRSLQRAADVVNPGDDVIIADGVYTNDDKRDGSGVLKITRSGKPDAWISWKAVKGSHPVIRPKAWAGILVTASYQILDGLTVIGNNDEIVLSHAQEDAKKSVADGYFNTNGIYVNGRTKGPSDKPHHVIIRNCEIGKCAGGGITAIQADYITVEDCKVYQNAWYMRYAGSGISFLNNWLFDDTPGYHMIVQRNYVWDNKTLVFWEKIGKLSDGNGIIMDVTNLENQVASNPNGDASLNPAGDSTKTISKPIEQSKAIRPEWNGRTLIANNVSAFNGGSGIHTFRTKHVDIINNTTYWNGQTVGYQEIFPNNSEDVVILNNIMVPRPGGMVTSNSKNKNITWDYNLYPTEQQVLKGQHDIIADPQFIKIELNPLKGNFRLKKGSLGRDSGTDQLPEPTDIAGKKRPAGKARDRGAFEQ